VVRLFIPAICLHCEVHIEPLANGDALSPYLCPSCLRSFRLLDSLGTHELKGKRYRFSGLHARILLDAGFPFGGADGIVQTLVHCAKYNSMMQLAERLGETLIERTVRSVKRADLIVPVPLHRTRYAERGYNQAERLARGIAGRLNIPVADRSILLRLKQTPTQTGLNLDEREDNIRGAFALGVHAQSAIRGKRVILVDDVMTTGATLATAASALDKGGPRSITVLALALAESK
jgi:ComF family protein